MADKHHCWDCGRFEPCEEVTVQGHAPDCSIWLCAECAGKDPSLPQDAWAARQSEKEAEL